MSNWLVIQEEERSQEILLRGNSNHCYLNEGELPITGYDNGEQMHYFNLTTIRLATNNFSDENKLGEGGFGPVYKVQIPIFFSCNLLVLNTKCY